MTAEICGTTPEASVLRRKMSAYAPSESDALLDARAARVVEADDRRAVLHREVHDRADLLRVRLAHRAAEDGEVLGEARTPAARPRGPKPATTPSPVMRLSAMPKSAQRCVTNVPISANEPGSSSSSRRSRAVRRPLAWIFAMRSAPPPASACFAPAPKLGQSLLSVQACLLREGTFGRREPRQRPRHGQARARGGREVACDEPLVAAGAGIRLAARRRLRLAGG